MPPEEAREAFHLGKDAQDWKVQLAQDDVRRSGPKRDNIVPILYRPFDVRYTYYTGQSRGFLCRPRGEVMRNMLHPNIGLVTRRAMLPGRPCNYVFACDKVMSDGAIRSDNRGGESLFPLYCYSEDFGVSSLGQRLPNIDAKMLDNLSVHLGSNVNPEQLLGYVYSILYSDDYRRDYSEFLTLDFSRMPFTKNRDTFFKLAELGQQLIELHLMRSPELDNPISRFCGKGDSAVTKVEYDADRGRVGINPTQYFDAVTPDLWSYQIGGYQVLAKWLKDRKGRFLTSADTIHYSRIVTSIFKTQGVQQLIDRVVGVGLINLTANA
jgi:predicted helicase